MYYLLSYLCPRYLIDRFVPHLRLAFADAGAVTYPHYLAKNIPQPRNTPL
jgi:hypothetical protein